MAKSKQAFTLVEMLVALAVSSIIIIASYASYDLVATQYRKNLDIADMHTSGRAIMRIIERDIRMAGFEYRDKDAKVTYGTISSPLNIKDSGNKCCDEVTVIYDYFDEESKKAERIRIRYWAEPHTSNKGSRHRLYKQKDILGQNKKILAKPKLGTKDVMADYIEDFQLTGTVGTGLANLLYTSPRGKHIKTYEVQSDSDNITLKDVSRLTNLKKYKSGKALAIGSNLNKKKSNELIFIGDCDSNKIHVVDLSGNSLNNLNNIGCAESLSFNKNGLLYVGSNSGVKTYDTSKKYDNNIGTVVTGIYTSDHTYESIANMSNDLMLLSACRKGNRRGSFPVSQRIEISTKKVMDVYDFGCVKAAVFYKNLLYVSHKGFTFLPKKWVKEGVRIYELIKTTHDNSIRKDGWSSWSVDDYMWIKVGDIKGIASAPESLAMSSDGLMFMGMCSGVSYIYDTNTMNLKLFHYVKKPIPSKNEYYYNHLYNHNDIDIKKIQRLKSMGCIDAAVFKDVKIKKEQQQPVTINLTLRTKNQYGKGRQFKKKDHNVGNYNFDFNDKYIRNTFSTAVLVRSSIQKDKKKVTQESWREIF